MAKTDSTTKDHLEKGLELLTELAGIALCGLAAHDGEEGSTKELEQMLTDMESPWGVEALQRGAFQGILRLAGDAWYAVKEADNKLQGEDKLRAIV